MKKYIAIAIVLILCLILFTGCGATSNSAKTNNRLFCLEFNNSWRVYVDRNTNVMYLHVTGGYGGLTVMLDADGRPLLYEGDNCNISKE